MAKNGTIEAYDVEGLGKYVTPLSQVYEFIARLRGIDPASGDFDKDILRDIKERCQGGTIRPSGIDANGVPADPIPSSYFLSQCYLEPQRGLDALIRRGSGEIIWRGLVFKTGEVVSAWANAEPEQIAEKKNPVGRPNMMAPVVAEFERRIAEREHHRDLTKEVSALMAWADDNISDPRRRPVEKTIRANIRDRHLEVQLTARN